MRKAVIVMVVLIALLVLSIVQAMQINTLKQTLTARQAAAELAAANDSGEYYVGDPNDTGNGYYVQGDNAYADGSVPAPDNAGGTA